MVSLSSWSSTAKSQPRPTQLKIKVAVVGTSSSKVALKALDCLLKNDVCCRNTTTAVTTKTTGEVHEYCYVSDEMKKPVANDDDDDNDNDRRKSGEAPNATTVMLGKGAPNDFFQTFRDDTVLSFVVIPVIEDAKAAFDGHAYLTEHWKTFDCALIVVDPFQAGEKTHQMTIQNIQRLLVDTKKIPTMVICHCDKSPQINHQEGRKRIAQLEEQVRLCNESHKTKTNHSTMAPMKIGMMSYDSDSDDDDDDSTVYLGDDADYDSTGSMSFDINCDYGTSLYNLDDCASELQSQWSFQKTASQLMEFYVAPTRTMKDDEEYPIQIRLRGLVGTIEAQTQILLVQKETAIKNLKAESFFPFVQTLRGVCERYRNVDPTRTFKDDVTSNFWDIYAECEDGSFSRFEREMNPERLAFPLQQLCDYRSWIGGLQWKEEEAKLMVACNDLVRRQLNFVLHKNSRWSFDNWYRTMNSCGWTKSNLPHQQDWNHISPSDWGTIINSLLLASSDRCFYESFGREKIALERARYISVERTPSPSCPFTASDGCPSLDHALDGNYDHGRFLPRYKQTFECVVRFDVPEKLSDPSHWGYIAYQHSRIVRSSVATVVA